MIGILYPKYLYLIIPMVLALVIILKMDFLRAKDEDFMRKERRKMKLLVLVSRIVIFTCLILALATPFTELKIQQKGLPRLTILVDNSSSMELFDTHVQELKQALEDKIPLKISYIARNTTSNLGEGILSNMEEESNMLLVSDGNNNEGISLADVFMEAASLNTTISALELEPVRPDASALVLGDSKTFTDVEYKFIVQLLKANMDKVNIKVVVDDEVLLDKETAESKIPFTKKFSAGTHKITAQITNNDHFSKNNVFYKVVRVVEKPKVLLVSEKQDPIEQFMAPLYTVEKQAQLPSDLSPYYMVAFNDVPAAKLNPRVVQLTDYLIDGNGLLFIGGFNSFDRGGYKSSLTETLLPVKVGAAEKKKGNSNIVIVIDISGASDLIFEGKKISPLDVTKALAIEVIKTLNLANRVGVVAFNDQAYEVTSLAPLYENKAQMEDKIKRLLGGGQSSFDVGLKGAYEMLKNAKGDKDIILLTDGLAYKGVQDRAAAVVDSLARLGIKVYVVGVGRDVQADFLQDLALRGNGIYFPASDSNRLTILFGEPEKIDQGKDFSLFILNPNHFITKDLQLGAIMNGYNQVIPKTAARMLVTTQAGEPALTVWNYGIGRVGTINVFQGGNLGPLFAEGNSLLLSRTINWLISDPEQKKEYLVMIDDGYVNTPFIIRVRSAMRPEAEGFDFHKSELNLYESNQFYVQTTGYNTVLDTSFAVNNEKEFEFVGLNPELSPLVESTGGKLFKPAEINQIPDFVINASKKIEVKKVYLTWPLLVLAILVFLVEIGLRKMNENLKEKKEKPGTL
ncbi:MAG: VWA domain-containing protein [Nanoarchaeota archaeon]